ncbi:hypothetical protein Agub_g14040 [Astrephomene gubernaculifera]|uniref:DUF2322 family protein n=1 Tax=Astrephomene gubernaculifera TaxID=47775 RepID=A0AAD3E0X8_9CHLO|nr:hypothetical protein Agub_g14040 [Astrephomene gubernaculifera]
MLLSRQATVSRRPFSSAPANITIKPRVLTRATPRPELPSTTNVARVCIPDLQWSIDNVDGKRLSVAIFTHLAATYGNKLTKEGAEEGLRLYGDVVQDAHARPGAHPNIELLMRVAQEGSSYELSVERTQ